MEEARKAERMAKRKNWVHGGPKPLAAQGGDKHLADRARKVSRENRTYALCR